MVASIPPTAATKPHKDHPEKQVQAENRVLTVLMRRLGSSQTFGENMIFMLNRAGKHLLLRLYYPSNHCFKVGHPKIFACSFWCSKSCIFYLRRKGHPNIFTPTTCAFWLMSSCGRSSILTRRANQWVPIFFNPS